MLVSKGTNALDDYCAALGWDAGKLKSVLCPTGIADINTYLIAPNERVVEGLLDFLTLAGAGLFIIEGETGSGKSALKTLIQRTLVNTSSITMVAVAHPDRQTPHQVAVALLKALAPTITIPKSAPAVLEALEGALIDGKQNGKPLVIWVDEGQKLTFGHVALLRGLTDVTTPTGAPCCKVVIAGSGGLQSLLAQGATDNPDEGAAIEGRCGLYTMALSPWGVEHVDAWIARVCETVATTNTSSPVNPFEVGGGAVIHKMSGGKPRVVVQIVELVLIAKAKQFARDVNPNVMISRADIEDIMRRRCER